MLLRVSRVEPRWDDVHVTGGGKGVDWRQRTKRERERTRRQSPQVPALGGEIGKGYGSDGQKIHLLPPESICRFGNDCAYGRAGVRLSVPDRSPQRLLRLLQGGR